MGFSLEDTSCTAALLKTMLACSESTHYAYLIPVTTFIARHEQNVCIKTLLIHSPILVRRKPRCYSAV